MKSAPTAINVRVRDREIGFVCMPTKLSRTVFSDIVEGKIYPLFEVVQDVGVVLDVGANIGAASVYFALSYPSATIHALEPAGEPFELLAFNASKLPNIRAEQIGLYSRNATVPLYKSPSDSETASVGGSALNSSMSEKIELRRASEWAQQQNLKRIDILKLDTEGCEIPILESLLPLIPGMKAIYVEYHSEHDRLRIDALLHDTHILMSGKASHLHRGEFCYVSKSVFRSEQERDRWKIVVDL